MKNVCITISGNLGNDFLFQVRQFSQLCHIKGELDKIGKGCFRIVAEGKKSDLDRFLKFCLSGLFELRIKETTICENEVRNYRNFTIN